MCMWFRIKNACNAGAACRYSHDKSISLSGEEKKVCVEEMVIRYEWNNGKQPPPRSRTPGGTGGKGGGKPAKIYAADGPPVPKPVRQTLEPLALGEWRSRWTCRCVSSFSQLTLIKLIIK